MDALAARYANVLYEDGLEQNRLAQFQNEAKDVLSLIENDDDLITLLDSRFLGIKERQDEVDEIFSKYLSDEFIIFLKIVIANDRIRELENILKSFVSMANEHFGIAEGIVYSTEKLSESQLKNIENSLSKKEGKQVSLTNRINPSLIGGIKVIINDHIYDGSIGAKIDGLRKKLL